MKKRNPFQQYRLINPLALAVACIILLLFASATQHYLNTAKSNLNNPDGATIVCFQTTGDPSPEDRPDAWGLEKLNTFYKQQKNNILLTVTFDIHRDYRVRLKGCFYGLSQPSAWLPSIPIAHRKLII